MQDTLAAVGSPLPDTRQQLNLVAPSKARLRKKTAVAPPVQAEEEPQAAEEPAPAVPSLPPKAAPAKAKAKATKAKSPANGKTQAATVGSQSGPVGGASVYVAGDFRQRKVEFIRAEKAKLAQANPTAGTKAVAAMAVAAWLGSAERLSFIQSLSCAERKRRRFA